MDPDDLVVEAFGVLLTQVRTARRALEDVQRSTSRYQGFEFAQALSQGSRFGAPPMFDGALKVHIVNINDLAPGNSFGGFLEAIFGGIGNFFGNLLAGSVGGLLSSLALPDMIAQLDRIVENVKYIVDKIGIGQPDTRTPEQRAQAGSTPEAQAGSGATLLTTLEGVRGTIRDITALFQAASDGPGGTAGANRAGETSSLPLTRTGERWMAILDAVNRLLDRTTHLVNGLVILIPNVVGAIALLVANLSSIRRALLETVQFVLRGALILRGVLLTVIFETVSSAARLAASIVGILGTTIQAILTSILGAVQALLGAVFDALRTLTAALQAIVESLLRWLVTGVFNTLRSIGDLQVFRTIDHLIRVIPALLPAIYMLMNQGHQLPDSVMTLLETAVTAGFPAGGAGTGTGTGTGSGGTGATTVDIGAFPNLDPILDSLESTLTAGVDATGNHLSQAAQDTFGAIEGTFNDLSGRMDRAVRGEVEFSRGIQERHVERIRGQADTLADTITAPLEAVGPSTGMERIADAYRDWLVGGGLNALGGLIEQHFVGRPAEGEPGGALRLLRGQFDRPRASIEIDRVEIVVEAPGEAEAAPGAVGPTGLLVPEAMSDEDIYLAVLRHHVQLEARGITVADPVAHVA